METGTHHELLRGNGAYANFVQSQKLKESAPSADDVASEVDEAEKGQREEKDADVQQADPDTEKMISTLRRTDTAPSLASAVLKEKAAARDAEATTEYAFFYAFGRMARINRDAKWLYLWGCLGAAVGGMVFPVFGIIYGESVLSGPCCILV